LLSLSTGFRQGVNYHFTLSEAHGGTVGGMQPMEFVVMREDLGRGGLLERDHALYSLAPSIIHTLGRNRSRSENNLVGSLGTDRRSE
jgi:hypothetical protein